VYDLYATKLITELLDIECSFRTGKGLEWPFDLVYTYDKTPAKNREVNTVKIPKNSNLNGPNFYFWSCADALESRLIVRGHHERPGWQCLGKGEEDAREN